MEEDVRNAVYEFLCELYGEEFVNLSDGKIYVDNDEYSDGAIVTFETQN